MKKLKRITYCFLFFLLIITVSPALAQAPNSSPQPSINTKTNNYDIVYQNVKKDVPRNLSTLTQSTLISVLTSAVCMLSGLDPMNPQDGKCLGVDVSSGKIAYTEKGSGGTQLMAGLIGGTFSIPVSSAGYAQYAYENFGLTKRAYAQEAQNGLGFTYLQPLVKIWATFRNMAYLFFVLTLTFIGLAVMLRVKIDARTVMTIQNQIPKIVIALILVTFSYAIVGFMIDLMYVAIYLVILLFSNISNHIYINPNSSVFSVVNGLFQPQGDSWILKKAVGENLYNIFSSGIFNLTSSVSNQISSVFASIAYDFVKSAQGGIFSILWLPFQAVEGACNLLNKTPIIENYVGCKGNMSQWLFKATLHGMFFLLAFFVVLIAIVYSLFRVWILLIRSFVYILIDTMIGPLWIAAGVFPGSKLNFTSWIKHLLGHLSVFPMTFAVILLGKTIMDGISSTNGQLFSPPLVGSAVGGNHAIAAFVGFGFIISLPSILDKTKKAVGAMDFGLTDVKAGFGTGIAVPQKTFGEYTKMKKETRTFEPTDTAGVYRRPGWGTVIRRRIGI